VRAAIAAGYVGAALGVENATIGARPAPQPLENAVARIPLKMPLEVVAMSLRKGAVAAQQFLARSPWATPGLVPFFGE